MTQVTRFILVRHGETLANRDFRYIGRRDDALSEHGKAQARLLAEALAILPITAIYSSPLQRAYQTAEAIATMHGRETQMMDALIEGSFGEWEGLSRAEVLARDRLRLLAWEQDTTVAPPGGESFSQVHERVYNAVTQLAHLHPDQTVALVSHVGPIKVLLCAALGAPLSSLYHIFLDPATISVIDWQETRPLLRLFNSHAHLGWQEARWIQSGLK
jgi:broad specificity phosphatase PhoE